MLGLFGVPPFLEITVFVNVKTLGLAALSARSS